ncbi:hypothetical protein CC78DRAFT_613425 [Lojkania enalia]|uniref:Uncharacterized protein n=1 Tax=Lojkania enalia TaxID=147567 RepID=A0A9P4KGM5_9PLEO|nr:hypothetical protein CC78DRAFT_613425 [Didymosphaeria enalia]
MYLAPSSWNPNHQGCPVQRYPRRMTSGYIPCSGPVLWGDNRGHDRSWRLLGARIKVKAGELPGLLLSLNRFWSCLADICFHEHLIPSLHDLEEWALGGYFGEKKRRMQKSSKKPIKKQPDTKEAVVKTSDENDKKVDMEKYQFSNGKDRVKDGRVTKRRKSEGITAKSTKLARVQRNQSSSLEPKH